MQSIQTSLDALNKYLCIYVGFIPTSFCFPSDTFTFIYSTISRSSWLAASPDELETVYPVSYQSILLTFQFDSITSYFSGSSVKISDSRRLIRYSMSELMAHYFYYELGLVHFSESLYYHNSPFIHSYMYLNISPISEIVRKH